ncbi:hypothetical protein [Reichenbachiella sp. MSK19-1]|nr:hypothetical protein [Reichenbachiella sp. MSK19-1]
MNRKVSASGHQSRMEWFKVWVYLTNPSFAEATEELSANDSRYALH